jgi:hypothetical protein
MLEFTTGAGHSQKAQIDDSIIPIPVAKAFIAQAEQVDRKVLDRNLSVGHFVAM